MKTFKITWLLLLAGISLNTKEAGSATELKSQTVNADWIKESNTISETFAKEFGQLVPESASSIGYSEFDSLGSEVSLSKEKDKEQFYKKWAGFLGKKISEEKNRNLKIDLEILLAFVKNNIELIKIGDEVGDIGFYDGSKMVFNEIQAAT